MADVDLSAERLAGFEYGPRGIRYPYSPRPSWPISIPAAQNDSRNSYLDRSANTVKRSTSPFQSTDQLYHLPADPLQGLPSQLQHQSQVFGQPMPQQQGSLPQLETQNNLYEQSAHQQQPQQQEQQSQQLEQQQQQQQQQAYQCQTQSDIRVINPDWHLPQSTQSQIDFPADSGYVQNFAAESFNMPYQRSSTDYVPEAHAHYEANLANSYLPLPGNIEGLTFDWQDFSNGLMAYPASHGLPDMNLQNLPNSPTDTSLEVRSLSSSDNGWTSVEYPHRSFDGSYQDPGGAIFNPGQTLHGRTFSDSSYSDIEPQSRLSWGSFVEVPQHAIGSPSSDSADEMHVYTNRLGLREEQPVIKQEPQQHSPVLTTSATKPIRIKTSPSSPQRSPILTGRISPPGVRKSKKGSNAKASKAAARRLSQPSKVETEKKVGRRKGPLRPDQRKQACEIRKLGACLRCKFLKKTCDKGEPCEGCKPAHARLWQVPCTRIDIKDIAYFMKDWRADCERHVNLGYSIGNIKGFADTERTLFLTHGYGHLLPVCAREIFVRDERCFGMEWRESMQACPSDHSVNTAKLSAGMEGISTALLSDYLDQHLDTGFPGFVDDYFEGTPFLTEMLKTAYRFWDRERTPIIRKSLKFLLAYNLTSHLTMVEGIPDEEGFSGKITDKTSKFYGKTVAPVMIHFQLKCAMADMWRELQKDILDELSHLYSSVYTKDKLKHWPTIFMVVSILLAVWEEMQFDSHYRVTDRGAVEMFCNNMESTPVGVIVGLFGAISQKLPSFQEWDTRKHHHLLNSNPAVCDALTEVRDNVTRHEKYLRTRCITAYNSNDFDSLSNKFTSKLVIRASAC